MRQDVLLQFGPEGEVDISVPAQEAAWPPEVARRWLDDQFVANDCEPLRASGKVLTVDKLLAIAQTVGPQRFRQDAGFRDGYARAAIGALARPVVRIDVLAGQVQS